MTTLYYPPFRATTEDELLKQSVVALARYCRQLAVYDIETLEIAWAKVISEHGNERWPTIGKIVAACDASKRKPKQGDPREKARQEEVRIAQLVEHTLFETDLGQRAAIERWPQDLKLFIEREGRVPNDLEISRMSSGPERTERMMLDFRAKIDRGEEVVAWPSLQNIHRMMIERNAELAEAILKGREGEGGAKA